MNKNLFLLFDVVFLLSDSCYFVISFTKMHDQTITIKHAGIQLTVLYGDNQHQQLAYRHRCHNFV